MNVFGLLPVLWNDVEVTVGPCHVVLAQVVLPRPRLGFGVGVVGIAGRVVSGIDGVLAYAVRARGI